MPATEVRLFQTADGKVPLLAWLDRLPEMARVKCLARIERLRELGHELRRPEADYLRDDIRELRVRLGRVNYRILYFFSGGRAVLSHGLTKKDRVPAKDIDQAVRGRKEYQADPERHTYRE